MKHTADELYGIAHHHYPRGVESDDPRYKDTEEYQRLVAARRRAGADKEAWYATLERLSDKFPENHVQNGSLHLPTGQMDAAYLGNIFLPSVGGYPHCVGFMVSFLVPYYLTYTSHYVEDAEATKRRRESKAETVSLFMGDTMHIIPRKLASKEARAAADRRQRELPPVTHHSIGFEPNAEERPYMEELTREIEATFGSERMPPEVGDLIVPDVSTERRHLGKARLYDCLFSDHW